MINNFNSSGIKNPAAVFNFLNMKLILSILSIALFLLSIFMFYDNYDIGKVLVSTGLLLTSIVFYKSHKKTQNKKS